MIDVVGERVCDETSGHEVSIGGNDRDGHYDENRNPAEEAAMDGMNRDMDVSSVVRPVAPNNVGWVRWVFALLSCFASDDIQIDFYKAHAASLYAFDGCPDVPGPP